ncbi:hypothetical protein [Acidisarcina polymorpha]|uniref:hypothetical protein n=1 Tax=Acidisarcina polymorpha TaxID=2211140 RepID=UPI000DEFFC8B|nr:hypothetical protein [Acidisarcina polymorpha]
MACSFISQFPARFAALLNSGYALDGCGRDWIEQLIVGHLAGELTEWREPEVDGRSRKPLVEECGPVLLD